MQHTRNDLPNIVSAQVRIKMKFVGISFLLAYFPFATFLALVGARENTSCYTRLRRSVVRIMQELAMVAFILFIGIAIVLSPYVAALADM